MKSNLKNLPVKSAFYNLRNILGNANWAEFFCIIAPRQSGKTYAVIDYYVSNFIKDGTPFY